MRIDARTRQGASEGWFLWTLQPTASRPSSPLTTRRGRNPMAPCLSSGLYCPAELLCTVAVCAWMPACDLKTYSNVHGHVHAHRVRWTLWSRSVCWMGWWQRRSLERLSSRPCLTRWVHLEALSCAELAWAQACGLSLAAAHVGAQLHAMLYLLRAHVRPPIEHEALACRERLEIWAGSWRLHSRIISDQLSQDTGSWIRASVFSLRAK